MGILSWLRNWNKPERVDYDTQDNIQQPEVHDKKLRQALPFNPHYVHTNSKGVTYHLNTKMVSLRGGKDVPIYYFSKEARPEAAALPVGWSVRENPRNGFLTVSRPQDPSAIRCEDE